MNKKVEREIADKHLKKIFPKPYHRTTGRISTMVDAMREHTNESLDEMEKKIKENLELRQQAEVDDDWNSHIYKEATDDLLSLINNFKTSK